MPRIDLLAVIVDDSLVLFELNHEWQQKPTGVVVTV